MKVRHIGKLAALSAFLLTACGAPANSSLQAENADVKKVAADGPVVIELFQSQGCSSCPPANAALNKLAGRKDVIALSYAVTYWDKLGWKDRFASPAFTQRQYDYRDAMKGDSVYTPQVVLNGRKAIVGNGKGELDSAIAASKAVTGGPSIALDKDRISIGAGTSGSGATVWLVRYDPRTHNVAIKAGENGGRTLPHRNIVHSLEKLGSWTGKDASFALPAQTDNALKSVILVQQGAAGPILSAKAL